MLVAAVDRALDVGGRPRTDREERVDRRIVYRMGMVTSSRPWSTGKPWVYPRGNRILSDLRP